MSAIHPEVRVLAEAVRTALEVPHPADAREEPLRIAVLGSRVVSVLAALDLILDSEAVGLHAAMEGLRAVTRLTPATYKTYTPGQGEAS